MISFIIGLFVGNFIGVALMALLAMAKDKKPPKREPTKIWTKGEPLSVERRHLCYLCHGNRRAEPDTDNHRSGGERVMPKCKDCVHVEVRRFKDLAAPLSDSYIRESECIEKRCGNFKDRSRFVELPYPIKPHDKVWYILEGLGEFDLKDYDISSGDCAVGNVPDTVIDVGIHGFWVNQLSERNEDYLVPDDCDFISWDEIGKTYFLTREAAEQALKEREAT